MDIKGIKEIKEIPKQEKESKEFKEYKQKSWVKPFQFKYPKEKSMSASHHTIPLNIIQTVREKIFAMGETEKQQISQQSKMEAQQNYTNSKVFKSNSYKTIIIPRDANYKPELLIFGRYQYENYSNYAYKNPFRPPAPNVIRTQEKTYRKTLNYQNNLQSIYCKTRFQNFQGIVEDKLRSTHNQFRKGKEDKIKSSTSTSAFQKVKVRYEQQPQVKKPYRIKVGASTLANLIKEFTILQRLTATLQSEILTFQKFKDFELVSDKKPDQQMIFLEVLLHRFGWLKKLNKRIVERIFNALGVENFDKYCKINLKIYIEFVKIFVTRDAKPDVLSNFFMKFFFGKTNSITYDIIQQTLDLMDGPQSKHRRILESFKKMFIEPTATDFKSFCEKNVNILNSLIDLFIF